MFQSTVNQMPAIGVAGDFASANPYFNVLSTMGGFVAAAGGAIVGHFAWATGTTVSSAGTGPVTGFVHRSLNAAISNFAADSSNVIPQGMPVTLMSAGDFLVSNTGGAVTIGMKAFASTTDGSVSFAAAGTTVAGSVETKFSAMSAAAAGEIVKISSVQLG